MNTHTFWTTIDNYVVQYGIFSTTNSPSSVRVEKKTEIPLVNVAQNKLRIMAAKLFARNTLTIVGADLSHSRKLLAFSTTPKSFSILDIETRDIQNYAPSSTHSIADNICKIQFSPQDRYLVIFYNDSSKIHFYGQNYDNNQNWYIDANISFFDTIRFPINLVFSAHSNFCAPVPSIGADTISIYNCNEFRQIAKLDVYNAHRNSISFHPHLDFLCAFLMSGSTVIVQSDIRTASNNRNPDNYCSDIKVNRKIAYFSYDSSGTRIYVVCPPYFVYRETIIVYQQQQTAPNNNDYVPLRELGFFYSQGSIYSLCFFEQSSNFILCYSSGNCTLYGDSLDHSGIPLSMIKKGIRHFVAAQISQEITTLRRLCLLLLNINTGVNTVNLPTHLLAEIRHQ